MPTKMESNKAHIIRTHGGIKNFVLSVDAQRYGRNNTVEKAVREHFYGGYAPVQYGSGEIERYMNRIYGKGGESEYHRVMTVAGISLYKEYQRKHSTKRR